MTNEVALLILLLYSCGLLGCAFYIILHPIVIELKERRYRYDR